MTVYEHAMIGINGTLALGLNRRHGWQIVALGGLAAVSPDLDGLTILLGPSLYAEGHRLWGHNLLIAGLFAAILSAIVYQTDAFTRIHRRLANRWQAFRIGGDLTASLPRRTSEMLLWIGVGVLAAYSHLLMDVFFSCGGDIQVWGVSLVWPFSAQDWAYPLVPCGNIGATIILAASMFAMLRWPHWIQTIATASLITVAGYMLLCGLYFFDR